MEVRRKDKTPLTLKFMAWFVPNLERIAPGLAKRLFVHIFFTPAHYPFPKKEKEWLDKAIKKEITFKDRKVMTYSWGDGKPVLVMHGWMGRTTQFRKFIERFNEAGYKVVGFDAPAHGNSEGLKSHLMYFVQLIEMMHKEYGLKGVIGHSLGGVAGLHVIHRGADIPSLVMIGSPSMGDEIIGEFLRRLNGSWTLGQHFKEYIQETYNQPFEHYTAEYVVQHIENLPLLLIYDEDDIEVKIKHAEAIKEKYPKAILVRTKGLGHTRILRDEEVIEEALNFINSHS